MNKIGFAMAISLLSSLSLVPRDQAPAGPDTARNLRLISTHRIYFGHQSVGANAMQGLEALLLEYPGSGVAITDANAGSLPSPGWFAHLYAGNNGDTASKCESFRAQTQRLAARGLEVALFKYCYVDLMASGNPEKELQAYVRTLRDLEQRYPSVRFIPVTVPLTARPSTWREMLARHPDEHNAARARFNEALRAEFAGKPIFDLAAVEATLPDGTRNEIEYQQTRIPALADAYTYDGGHLNAEGQRRAAAELVKVLASLFEQKGGTS